MKGLFLKAISLVVFLILVCTVSGQDEIHGKVYDAENGKPLTGANIWIPDQKNGTISDANGGFQIPVKKFPLELTISYLGYADTNIHVTLQNQQQLLIYLKPDSLKIASIVVTASRIFELKSEIPQRVNVIDQKVISKFPANNTDDLLKSIPGVNVNRSWGIFSRNASVTMRGMPGSTRSLILIDGTPLNKTAGGTVNWHLVTPEEIDKIEVVKGPGSSIYGNNAMGGVINIITSTPKDKFSGFAGLGYGTYNTLQGQLLLNADNREEGCGFFWKLGSFYRQGDGYILEPEESRNDYSSKAFLKEGNANGLLGYSFSPSSQLELDYRFYRDKRGSGIKVYENDGAFEQFTNNNLKLSYNTTLGKVKIDIKSFYFLENYLRQNENVNNSGEYKLVDTETDKHDVGLWMTGNLQVGMTHQFTTGLDIKHGTLDNHEIYRTSTDNIATEGKQIFAALFAQDVITIYKKLILNLGVRIDLARFYDGLLMVEHPTDKTGFQGNTKELFEENSWLQVSPKVGINYGISEKVRTYINLARGFMPPRLDDLSGSRKIRRGFKIANPDLVPESITSLDWGFDFAFKEKFVIKPNLFYSRGQNFQYLVATGDYIESGSEDPIPVYQRQNVSSVEVSGAELELRYQIKENLLMRIAYSYNQSEILDYEKSGALDLTGKALNEVPENLFFAGLTWQNKYFAFFIDYTFTDDQWYDEENTEIIEGYSLVNFRISKPVFKSLTASMDVQDLFDVQFIDRKGYLSPGRFIMFELKYSINKIKNK